jgi:hypothetical protein
MTNEQDQLITQTESQRDPGKADPADFTISTENNDDVPGHGQRGRSAKEFNQLLAIRASKAGKSHPTGHGLQRDRNAQPGR